MPDYLNTMIQQPTAFIDMVMSGERNTNNHELNTRKYDALDGTLLHLVVMALLEPNNVIAYDDNTALNLVHVMINNGACPLIESLESRIPYELFHLYDVNPIEFQTYRYLLAKTTACLLEGSCKREFYEDYING